MNRRFTTVAPLIVGVLLSIVFVPWFAWLTVRGQLPGNTDTWLAIALSEDSWARFLVWLEGGGTTPSSMYPVGNVLDYGESGMLWRLLYGSLRLLTDDLVSIWNIIVCVMAIANGVGVAFLAAALRIPTAGAVVAGFFFSVWGFWFANIDDANYHFYALTAVAMGCSRIALRKNDFRLMFYSGLLVGANAWSSIYVYVLSVLAWTVVLASDARAGVVSWRRFFLSIFAAILPALPVAFEMVRRYLTLEIVNPFHPPGLEYSLFVAKSTSVHLQDFLRPVRGTLLFPDVVGSDQPVAWSHVRRAAWPGAVFLIFWVVALLRLRGRPFLWAPAKAVFLLWAMFILIAIGPYLEVLGAPLPMPMLLVYMFIEPARFFRVPLRALTTAHLAASLIAAVGAQSVWYSFRNHGRAAVGIISLSVLLLQTLEHVPLPPVGYRARAYIAPPETLTRCVDALPDDAVLAFVPSSLDLIFYNDDASLYPFNREAIYMLWQIQLHRSAVNGLNGYLPPSRPEIDRMLRALPNDRSIVSLRQTGVTHLALIEEFAVHPREIDQVRQIRKRFAGKSGCGDEVVTVYAL